MVISSPPEGRRGVVDDYTAHTRRTADGEEGGTDLVVRACGEGLW